jgi:uncharacterized protein YjbI with pentapeptide repeats
MREADLTRANCQGSVLADVDLSGARWEGADLTKSDLRGSDLTAMQPAEVRLTGAVIHADQAVVVAQSLGFEVR